jgi:hypothetical protein
LSLVEGPVETTSRRTWDNILAYKNNMKRGSAYWISIVVSRASGTPDDVECVLIIQDHVRCYTVKENQVPTPCKWKGCYISKKSAAYRQGYLGRKAHRCSRASTWDSQLDDLIRREGINTSSRQQILGRPCSAHHL